VKSVGVLQGGIMELFMLRSAMSFDFNKCSWKFKAEVAEGAVKDSELKAHSIQSYLGSNMFFNHIDFVSSIHQLCRSDRMVLMLLFVIDLMSEDRPGLKDRDPVCAARQKFCLWMRAHLESKYGVREATFIYEQLLSKLNDVRRLGEASSKLASTLDITRLEPLLVEVFNLK
jgi:hypothetical protein